jgi:molecular chaperone HtpG
MVHSVYTEKEIFLRELISNASDACDKLRYAAITTPELLAEDSDLKILIGIDKDAGTLRVSDNGIGMTKAELIDNLGTIARSGTRAFLESFSEDDDKSGLIGQFGVGFYSAFMVADHIEVVSRRAGEDDCWLWVSDGSGGFSVDVAPDDAAARVARGTEVTLKLKDDAKTYLAGHEIERVTRIYSDHILFPILLDDPGAEAPSADADADSAESGPRQINAARALWQRQKSEVSEDDYKEVYRTVSGLFDEPALTLHYQVEGRQAYAVLLFVPSTRPYDLFDQERRGRVKLYVRRVFITDEADLLPSYLRFVRGVVDSEDVPLNISREMLQNNPVVAAIRKAVTGRVLSELEKLAGSDNGAYEKIWDVVGVVVKEGLYEDFERREQLLGLARFKTSMHEGWRSLKDYAADMKTNQTDVYYLAGESQEQLAASPALEGCRARGVEVLLLTDPIDHFWVAMAPDMDGKPFRSLTQSDVDLSNIALLDDAKPAEAPPEDSASLLEAMKSALKDEVSDVRLSKRLVDSPACLISGDGPDRGLGKILARQQQGPDVAKPILEINAAHALLQALSARAVAGEQDETFADLAHILVDQAHIVEGEVPPDPAAFAARLNRLLSKGVAG